MAAAADSGLALKVPACATRDARSQSGSPRKAIIDMMSRLPHSAPPGSPPATIFASVVISGVMPKRAWAPPGDQRNPVITSSKIRTEP
jgi:hypothetical protein